MSSTFRRGRIFCETSGSERLNARPSHGVWMGANGRAGAKENLEFSNGVNNCVAMKVKKLEASRRACCSGLGHAQVVSALHKSGPFVTTSEPTKQRTRY